MFCVNVNTMQQFHKCAKTPLILASCKGYVHIVELLLGEKNFVVNKADTQNGETALHCAANKGQAEVVKLLLERDDIDINTNVSNYGITPLMRASSWNYHEVV